KFEKTLGAKDPRELVVDELEQTHIYILKNCDEVLPYLKYGNLHKFMRMLDTCLMQNGVDNFLIGLKIGFKMKPLKIENEVDSNMKSAIKYTFVAPGNLPSKSILPQSSVLVKKYIKEIETTFCILYFILKEKERKEDKDLKSPPCPLVKEYKGCIRTSCKEIHQEVETSAIGKGQEKRIGSLSSSLGISEYEVGSFNKSAVFANDTPTK
ncbi:hypothetical protein H5410_016142, partial [Solanum commersonii]